MAETDVRLTTEQSLPIGFAVVAREPIFGNVVTIPALIVDAIISQLSFSYRTKKTTVKTLAGFIEFHWGDDLDVITANGVTAAFVGANGLESSNRESTRGYEDFKTILKLYKTNASFYDDQGRITRRGSISFIHDVGLYTGYFTSFSYSEDDKDPFRFKLNFEFKVEKTNLLFAPQVPDSPGGLPIVQRQPDISEWSDVKNLPKVQFDRLLSNLQNEFVSRGVDARSRNTRKPGDSENFDPGRVSFNKDEVFKRAQEKRDQRISDKKSRSSNSARVITKIN